MNTENLFCVRNHLKSSPYEKIYKILFPLCAYENISGFSNSDDITHCENAVFQIAQIRVRVKIMNCLPAGDDIT